MFSPPFDHFNASDPEAGWFKTYTRALARARTGKDPEPQKILQSALALWSDANTALDTDVRYHSADKYCIKQSFLGEIFKAFSKRFPKAPAERTVFANAKKIVQDTPAQARPLDVSFLNPPQAISKTLDHLQAVAAFYEQQTMLEDMMPPPQTSALPPLPPASPGFKCTVVIPPDMDTALARHFWQAYMNENLLVRTVALENNTAAQNAVTIIDTVMNNPGAGQKGRCLWIQKPELLASEIAQWLQTQGGTPPDALRCFFVKPSGKLSSVKKKTDPINHALVIQEYWKARQ